MEPSGNELASAAPPLDLKQPSQAASANVHVTTKPRTKLNHNVIHNNGRHRPNRNFQNRYELYLFHISHLAYWNAYESPTFEYRTLHRAKEASNDVDAKYSAN